MLNLGQNRRFFGLCDLEKFDRWPKISIGHLFYATANFVPHFIAMCEFELELQYGNTQKGTIFSPQ